MHPVDKKLKELMAGSNDEMISSTIRETLMKEYLKRYGKSILINKIDPGVKEDYKQFCCDCLESVGGRIKKLIVWDMEANKERAETMQKMASLNNNDNLFIPNDNENIDV